MFRMLTCFNLRPDSSIEEFSQSLGEFSEHLQKIDLIHSIGPVGRRYKHTILDTDSERDHNYFFITSFRDREQSDLAVKYMLPQEEREQPYHKAVYSKVIDPIFICWEDL